MKFVFSMTLALALLASAPALAYGGGSGDKIDVMTQNQYLGADLNPIIAAPDPIAFNQELIIALEQIAANNFPARARKLAQLIAFRRPELVGLQEMFQFMCMDLGKPTPGEGCDDPSISGAFNDHLALTLQELGHLHKTYVVGASVQNLDISLPVDTDLNGAFDILVTVVDRDVILARGDIAGSVTPVPYSAFCARPSADGGPGCNYTLVAMANTALGPIAIERGWVGVDATVNGKDYRFVNTHLEVQVPDPTQPLSALVQRFQAQELIGTLGATTPGGSSLIVVGDINSSPEDVQGQLPLAPPYDQLVAAGYTDAWTELRYPRDGFTCCQASDLLNKRSELSERIDVIFSFDVPDSVRRGRVLGATFWSKTFSTWPVLLWPSDHGSVAAELEF